MLKHEDNAVAPLNGNNLQPLAGISVTVTDKVTGLPAYLYADDGVTPLPNNVLTTDNKGYYGFKAPDGTYILTFSGQRIETFTREIVLDDPKDNPYATKAELAAGTGSSLVTFTPGISGASPSGLDAVLMEMLSVKRFGAKGDGITDDTAAIQKSIDSVRGKIYFPVGTYVVSDTIKIKPETILIGAGAGAYFQGAGYPRLSVIKPAAAFAGTDVLRADAADVSPGLSYTYGVALRDLLIDCINIKNAGKTIINLLSLSNAETFDSVRIINNNNNIALHIGKSSNVSAFESDGLLFSNLYTLACDSTGASTNPVVKITAGNEITFRDSKIQGGAGTLADSASVLLSASAGRAINSITFDAVAFTGAETGVLAEGKDADGQGPRHVRVLNCTTEGVKYGVRAGGTASRPVQFVTIGPGNRHIATPAGGTPVVLGAYACNSQVYADEATDVLMLANSVGNIVYGGGTVTDSGSNNARIYRHNGSIDVNGFYVEPWTTPTLGSGWSSNTVSRTTAAYRRDSFGKVFLRGYLTGGTFGYPNYIFTLPAGYRPVNGCEFAVANDNAAGACKLTVLSTGEIFASGGSGSVSLDGVSFAIA